MHSLDPLEMNLKGSFFYQVGGVTEWTFYIGESSSHLWCYRSSG